MPTDRELLELAAKAAGIAGKWGKEKFIEQNEGFIPTGWFAMWNPLRNDGHALRLAVTLRITVEHWLSTQDSGRVFFGDEHDAVLFNYSGDPYAATRRAIVCAAAEIGKAMP